LLGEWLLSHADFLRIHIFIHQLQTMNLFKQQRSPAQPEAIQQIKRWAYDALAIDPGVPISISQLQCHEPGCPPVETVIVVLTEPKQTYKIHAAPGEISQAMVVEALTGGGCQGH
jgi:hypothetical protein